MGLRCWNPDCENVPKRAGWCDLCNAKLVPGPHFDPEFAARVAGGRDPVSRHAARKEEKLRALRSAAEHGSMTSQLEIERKVRQGVLPPDEPMPWKGGPAETPHESREDEAARRAITALYRFRESFLEELPPTGDVVLSHGSLHMVLPEERELVAIRAEIEKLEKTKRMLHAAKDEGARDVRRRIGETYAHLASLRVSLSIRIMTLRGKKEIERKEMERLDASPPPDPAWSCPSCAQPFLSITHAVLHLRHRHGAPDDEILRLIRSDLADRLLLLCDERDEAERRKRACAGTKKKISAIVSFIRPLLCDFFPYGSLVKIFKKFPRWSCSFCEGQPFNTGLWDEAAEHLVEDHGHEPSPARRHVAAWFDGEVQKAIERIQPKEPVAKIGASAPAKPIDEEWIFTDDLEKYKKALKIGV
jgi:hypothetical protein